MRAGEVGGDVTAIQHRLHVLGFLDAVPAPGIFDAVTDHAVRAFQRARGLTVDGDVGPLTNIALLDRCYPLAELADRRRPAITSRHKIHEPTRPTHNGVDLFYRYVAGDPAMKVGDGGRDRNWWIPPGTKARAAAAGIVVNAGNSRTGFRCWIRHDGGQVATGYFHLKGLEAAIKVGARLELGAPLGEVGHNPSPAEDAIHLHFELYRGNIADDVRVGMYPRGTMDPEIMLAGARYLA